MRNNLKPPVIRGLRRIEATSWLSGGNITWLESRPNKKNGSICGSIVNIVEEWHHRLCLWQHRRYGRRMAASSASVAASSILSKNGSIVNIDEHWQHRQYRSQNSIKIKQQYTSYNANISVCYFISHVFITRKDVTCSSHERTSKPGSTCKLANAV